LKGKKIAVEKGLVDHHLLNTALDDAKVANSEVTLVNAVTNELPQVFASPDVSAIAVWQPVANQALKSVAGSKIIYSSKDKPGLIYDTLTVNMSHLSANKEDWKKMIKYGIKLSNILMILQHRRRREIMSKRVGVDSETV
jgi:NitT/TauT family transport system substrate-binding protein